MEKRKKYLTALAIAVTAMAVLTLCSFIALKGNSMYAESRDGLWKGYIVRSADGDISRCRGYLYYYGSRDGNAGRICVEQYEGRIPVLKELEPGRVSLSTMESLMIGEPRRSGYSLDAFFSREGAKPESIGIIWEDEKGEERYSSLVF